MKKNKKEFFSNINGSNIHKYQQYFLEIVDVVDVDEFTKWSQNLIYDRRKLLESLSVMKQILDKSEKDKLVSFDLEILFLQYIFANKAKRKKYKNEWVAIVVEKERNIDFLPDPARLWGMLFKDDTDR